MSLKKGIILLLALLNSDLYAWTHVGSNLFGWASPTVTFSVNPTNCTLPDATLYDLLDEAFANWNALPLTTLKVIRNETVSTTTPASLAAGTATDAPTVVCATDFGTLLSVDANQIPGATYRISSNSAGNIVYAGVFLNAQAGALAEISTLYSSNHDLLTLILAHEVGHALGLGHSSDPKALMYYSTGGKTKAVITQDDEDGIAQLYPASEFSGKPFGCAAAHQPDTSSPGWGTLCFLSVLMLLLKIGRRFKSERPL